MIKKELLREMKGSEKYIFKNVMWMWLALICQIIASISIAVLVHSIYKKYIVAENVIIISVIVFVAIGTKFICEKLATNAGYYASHDVKNRLRKRIYDKILQLGSSYREKTSTAELMQLSVDGVEQLEIYFGRFLPQLLYSLLAPVTLFFVVGTMSWKVAFILLGCVPLIPLSIVVVQKIAQKLLFKYWGIYTGLGDTFLENIQGLTTLKIYKSDEYKADEMDKEAEKFRKITMKVLIMQLNSISIMDLLAYGGAGLGIIVAISSMMAGKLVIWQCLAIILLAAEFFIPLRLLGSFFHIAMNGMAASDKIFGFLNREVQVKGNVKLEGEEIEISFENVDFAYENNRDNKSDDEKNKIDKEDKENNLTLKNINLTIDNGGFISIVGLSGSGKSTIASLMTGKYKNFTGKIQINGRSILELDESSLLDAITLVKYNSYIFSGTVEENLLMAKKDASEEEMIQVLEKVNLWDFLNSERGLQTRLEEQGGNFSGGQKQRLALARAILKDSKMYIFDEASSNIDVESEEIIMEVIKNLAKSKTVVVISHRMANVVDSDKIYVIESGRVIESGNHIELLEKNGRYKEIYSTQEELCGKWGENHEA